jgi:PEP-CTERM motif
MKIRAEETHMKRTLLATLVSLTFAMSSLYATQSLSFSGPTNWTPGGAIVLSTTDTFSNLGGAIGFSYWVQVNSAIAPFLTITDLTYFTWGLGQPPPPAWFPISFTSTSGADAGFKSTLTANGQSGDFGASGASVPDGSYHVTDITFAIAANAPIGTYTLRTTTAAPRDSIQLTSDFNDAPFPQASFVFNVVPEPSTLALIALTGIGAGVMAYRRRK